MALLFKLISLFANFSSKQKLIVLTYHRVLPGSDVMYPDEVNIEKFCWQMEILNSYFNVLSISDALEHIKAKTLPPRSICLSFDDGYSSCHSVVLPILKSFNFSACFFIVSSALNQRAMWNDFLFEAVRLAPGNEFDLSAFGLGIYSLHNKADAAKQVVEDIKYLPMNVRNKICKNIADLYVVDMPNLMLTEDNIKEMYQQGMEIGGHTVNHPILKNLSLAEAEDEIKKNKLDLEQLIDNSINFFAYPNGRLGDDYLTDHADIVREIGYKAAFSTDSGAIDKDSLLWQLPRFSPWEDSPIKFVLQLVRAYF